MTVYYKQHCAEQRCGQLTGRLVGDDDSIYCHRCGFGPLCARCAQSEREPICPQCNRRVERELGME